MYVEVKWLLAFIISIGIPCAIIAGALITAAVASAIFRLARDYAHEYAQHAQESEEDD